MRSFVLAFGFCLAGISACSFLLDTDDLKKAGSAAPDASAGTGGGGGSSSDASIGTEGGAALCKTAFDCQGLTFDGCKETKCVNGRCASPEKYSGLGVSPEGNIEEVFSADEIGYPTLLADNGNFYLGAWKRVGPASNIELRRFNENLALGGATADLATLLGNAYEQYGSSPGMTVVGLFGGRLRLLFAGDPPGMPPLGMHLIDIDELPTFKVSPPGQQPTVDPGVAGYDSKPRGPVPRLTADGGMWVQGDKLFFFDGKVAATPVYTAKRVLGFAPLAGILGAPGPYAVLETATLAMPPVLATEMWATGNMASLSALVGDEGGERRGVTVAPYPEALANVVVWAFASGRSGTTLKTNIAFCTGMVCQSAGGIDNSDDVPASLPEISSAKVMGRDRDRDFAETFQVSLAHPDDPGKASTLLIGSLIRVVSVADAAADAGTQATNINPPNFIVTASDGPTSAAPGEVIGPSSVAITNEGHVMMAWVERGMGTTHVLKIRRFAVTVCP